MTDRKDQVLAALEGCWRSFLEDGGVEFRDGKDVGLCPFHDDTSPSLSVFEADGKHRFRCHACGEAGDLLDFHVKRTGLSFREALAQLADRFGVEKPRASTRGAPVATYVYEDEQGAPLFRVLRYEGGKKTFVQQAYRDGEFVGGKGVMRGVRRVPYRLPHWKDAPYVVHVEGEKCVHSLEGIGVLATTSAGGASNWNPELALFYAGKKVAILPDADEPGMAYARDVGASLAGVAASVRVLEIPGLGEKEDVADWTARGGTRDKLKALIQAAPTLEAWAPEPGSFEPAPELEPEPAPLNGRAHPILRRLCDVHAAPISWLWKPYLARGKLSLIQGDPEAGKTFVTLAIAAAAALGVGIAGGEPLRGGPVLLLTGEDGLEDTIVPRLRAMDADLTRIVALEGSMAHDSQGEEREFSVTLADLNVLEEAILDVRPVLVVIDPIQAFLGGEVDAHRANEVRPILSRFARLAQTHGFAAVAVQHLNKTGGGHAIYRGLGSIDFVAAARSVLLAGKLHDGSRALVQIKNSLAPHGVSIGYTIAEDSGFSWTGPSRVTAADILAPEKPTAGAGAGVFLEVVLSEGPLPADEVIARAEEEGISRRTLYRARASIGVKSRQEGRTSIWYLEEVPERVPPVPRVPTPGTSRARGKGLAFGTGTDNPL